MYKTTRRYTIFFCSLYNWNSRNFFFQEYLPSKYYYDANTIKKFIALTTEIIPFNSYNNIAFFYKVIGFNQNSSLLNAGFFTFTLSYIFILIVVIFISRKIYITKKFLFIIFIWIILMSIYLGQFSKEITVLILSTILLIFAKYKEIYFLLLAIMLIVLYAYFFRIYWFIIIYLLILFYASEKIKGIFKYLFILVGIFMPFIISDYFLNTSITDARVNVNIGRINSIDAQTIILNPLPNHIWILDFLNSLIIFTLFIVPAPFLIKLSIKYIVFTLWVWVNIYIFFKSIYLSKILKFLISKPNYRRLKFSIYFIISYIMTQSLFEPDYGSFLKHQVGLCPIYIFLSSYYFYFGKILKRSFIWK